MGEVPLYRADKEVQPLETLQKADLLGSIVVLGRLCPKAHLYSCILALQN